MNDQPSPEHGLKVVYPEAIMRINEAIDHQVKKGLAEYHTFLMTFNGRKVATDWLQEQADVLIYGTQMAMEYEYVLELLKEAREQLYQSEVLAEDEGWTDLQTDILAVMKKIDRVLGPVDDA